MADIIVVEDNEEIGTLLSDFLEAEGYDTYLAVSGEEALAVYEDEGAKLVVLDIMLPGMDGFAICSRIREKDNTPIIIVSAKGTKEDKLNGLMLGADDYMEKPYDIDILLAKINGIFKRRYGADELTDGDVRLNRSARTAFFGEEPLVLTGKEFDLLCYLIENKGKVLSKEQIFNEIWGNDSESELQTLTVHIKRLREKLKAGSGGQERIATVWGVGYRYEEI